MIEALTLLNRRPKQYVDLAPDTCFSGFAKAIFPSYLANLDAFQPHLILETCVASPGRCLRFEGQFSPVTAIMAIV